MIVGATILTGVLAIWNGLPSEVRQVATRPFHADHRPVDGWVYVGSVRPEGTWSVGPFVQTGQSARRVDAAEPFKEGDVVTTRFALRVVVTDGGNNVLLPPPLASPVVREGDYTGQVLEPGSKWVVLSSYVSGQAVWLHVMTLGWVAPPPVAPGGSIGRALLLAAGGLLLISSAVLAYFVAAGAHRWRRSTLHFVLSKNGSFTHVGSVAGAPALQIASRWSVTNSGSTPLQLLDAQLLGPRPKHSPGGAMVTGAPRGVNMHSSLFQIAPGETYDVAAHFFVQPVPRNPAALKFRFGFIDQFGQVHVTPRSTLRHD